MRKHWVGSLCAVCSLAWRRRAIWRGAASRTAGAIRSFGRQLWLAAACAREVCASWVCAAVECTVGRSISLAGGFERALTRARGAIVLACGLVRRFVWACASRVRLLILAGYLVDPASSHMLVSKIKPCMSKYKRLYCETANGSLNQLWFI